MEPKHDNPDQRLIVTCTMGHLRQIVREEIERSMRIDSGPDELVNAKAAAKMLNISENWLRHNQSTLPFFRKVGSRVRFSTLGMKRWMQNKK